MAKAEVKKYPQPVVGAFIFNDNNELLLLRLKQWQDKYACPGGKIEHGEAIIQALKREVKEETNLDITDIRFFELIDGLEAAERYKKGQDHLIFIDYTARALNPDEIRINDEASEYEWRTVEDWLKNKKVLAHKFVIEALEKLKAGGQEDYEDKYRRALAELANLQRRTEKEKQETAKYAHEKFILEVLPVYDNLRLSIEHIDQAAEKNGWAQGIQYVIKQFKDILAGLGVEEIEARGREFDPATMEAIGGQGKKAKEVVKPGYTLHGKVIVPARVVLGD